MPLAGNSNINNTLLRAAAFLGMYLAPVFLTVSPPAAGQPPAYLQFSIQDPSGNFFPEGEIEFCSPDGICVYADIQPGFPGNFYLASEDLQPGVPYTVMIYDPQVTVLFEMREWIYVPEQYDPQWHPSLETTKFLVYPRFHVYPDRSMTFSIGTTLNPVWEKRTGRTEHIALPDSGSGFPEFLMDLRSPLLLGGRFSSDEAAAGGVTAVQPGLGLTGTWRSRYPAKLPARDGWVPFRELSFSYDQNRYDTREVLTPGRESDVTFHRVCAAYGYGRMQRDMRAQWSGALVAGWGGIFDGTAQLEYLGRSYGFFGVGTRARYGRALFRAGRTFVGAVVQAELMYYFADEGPNDFWYGAAPALALGLQVY